MIRLISTATLGTSVEVSDLGAGRDDTDQGNAQDGAETHCGRDD
jgi:hypothetical protein